MPSSRVRVFTPSGQPIGELDVATDRQAVLPQQPSNVGDCKFNISTSDSKCTLQYLNPGNLVLVEHIPWADNYGNAGGTLPPWVGVIDLPMNGKYGEIEVEAYSAEKILQWRTLPSKDLKGTGGQIVSEILNIANQAVSKAGYGTVILPGSIYTGGASRTETMGNSAFEIIRRIGAETGCDWMIVPAVDPITGALSLSLNFYNGNAGVFQNFVFEEGTNLKKDLSNSWSWQDNIWNDVFSSAKAVTDNSRIANAGDEQLDAVSVGQYGVRQTSNITSGNSSKGGATETAITYLEQQKQGIVTLTPTAVNFAGTFSNIALGNTCYLNTESYGFTAGGLGYRNTLVKIVGWGYNDAAGEAPLVMEIVNQ